MVWLEGSVLLVSSSREPFDLYLACTSTDCTVKINSIHPEAGAPECPNLDVVANLRAVVDLWTWVLMIR